MSTPTRELENLTIGGSMMSSRQAGQRRRRQRERDERIAQQEALRAAAPGSIPGPAYNAQGGTQQVAPRAGPQGNLTTQPAAVPVLGHTGLMYDVHQLSPNSRPRAIEGLHSDEFTVDHSMRYRDSSRIFYYGFQLKKPASVRIFDPASGRQSVTCTCDEFNRSRTPCVHMFWLYDGLNKVLADQTHPPPQLVTNETVLQRITDLYEQIGGHLDPMTNRLDSLTRALNRTRGEDEATESDEDESETDSQIAEPEDADAVIQDMLSIFDDRRSPEEYRRQDFIQDMPAFYSSLENLVVLSSLPATIYGLARHDRKLRRHLRIALNKEFCAAVHFLKKGKDGIRRILAYFDRHIADGRQSDPTIVDECAGRLRGAVEELKTYLEDEETAPPSKQVRSMAAEILVDLLRSVCDRNADIYTQITWNRTAEDPQDEDDRNLFTNLVGDADEESEDEYFVLNVLTNMPPNDWKHLLERLDTILVKLGENNAPRAYIEKLESIIRGYEIHHMDPTRTVGERPPISGEREPQRRRIA